MLVLGRKVGEGVRIGHDIVVRVVRIGQGGVRLGVEAPQHVAIVKEELELRELDEFDKPDQPAGDSDADDAK